MNTITEVIEVDIYEANATYVRANQANKNSRYLSLQLTQHGEPYTIPSGVIARIQGQRPDGQPILNDGTIQGNTITFELTEYMLAVSGTADVEVALYDEPNNAMITSSSFHLIIPPSPLDAFKIVNTTEFTTLINALNTIDQSVKDSEQAVETFAQIKLQWNNIYTDATQLIKDLNQVKTDTIAAKNTANTAAEQANTTNNNLKLAEANRVKAETTRVSNENTRIANEKSRQSTFTTKISETDTAISNANKATTSANQAATNANATNESIKTAETTRVSNENTRISNEKSRQTTFDAKILETNTAISNANKATKNAEDATILTNTAISNANKALKQSNATNTLINNAEQLRVQAEQKRETDFNSKIKEVNSTIANANISISNADKATERANIAAEGCEGIIAGTGLISSTEKGRANGVATLDGGGKIPSTQLPSYVDDIIEVAMYENLPSTGEKGKIYVTTSDSSSSSHRANEQYRWSGSQYIQLTNGIKTIQSSDEPSELCTNDVWEKIL